MAELMLGQPLFPGESGIDQLVEIIKVLGTPTREQIRTMNPNYMEHKFPQIKPHPFNKVCHCACVSSQFRCPPALDTNHGFRSSARRPRKLSTSSRPSWNTHLPNDCPRSKLCAILSSTSYGTRLPAYLTRAIRAIPPRISLISSTFHGMVSVPYLSRPKIRAHLSSFLSFSLFFDLP